MPLLVSVVLPCLDEEASVGLCVEEAIAAMTEAQIEGEVVVVDNGSVDESVSVARAAGARVILEPARGYGAALRAGINAAHGDIVVMADADATYDLRRLPDLVGPVMRGEADLVVGSRLETATRSSMPVLHRWLGTPVLSYLMRRAAGGISLKDGSSGFRAFRKNDMLALGLKGAQFDLMSEMHVRAGQAGFRFLELPTQYRERVGQSKLRTLADGWSNLKLIVLLAPDLLFVGPGGLLFCLGILVTALGFVHPGGLPVGSFTWQPVFFSSIALVLGLQSVLIGLVLTNQSWLRERRAGGASRLSAPLGFGAHAAWPAR